MKKYLLVSLAVLLTASFAWTEVVGAKVAEPKVDIEADATVTWGVDFGDSDDDTTKHGFKNTANFKVKVPLIDKQTSTSKGEGKVYAEVDVKDIELYMQAKKGKKGAVNQNHDAGDPSPNPPLSPPPTTNPDPIPPSAGYQNKDGFGMFGKVGGLSAKFVFYGAYLQIADAPSMKTNFAKIWLPLGIEGKDEYGKNSQDSIDAYEGILEPGFKGYGVKFGYMNKDLMDLDVGLKLVSNGDWEGKFDKYDGTAGKTVHSQYGLGLDLGMKPLKDLLAFNLGFNMTLAKAKDYKNGNGNPKNNLTADNLFFGIGAEVTSKPIDGLELKLGFDGGTKGSDFAWDMLFDAKYKWVSAGVYAADVKDNTHWWQATNKQTKKTGNVAFYLKFETKGKEKDPSFLLKGLDAGAYLGLFDLASYRGSSDNQLPVLLKVWGAYTYNFNDSMWIKPFANVWAESKHLNSSNKEVLGVAYNLGVTFSPVEKVEITADWSHGKFTDPMESHAKFPSTGPGVISHAANTDASSKHDGKLTFAVKVSY